MRASDFEISFDSIRLGGFPGTPPDVLPDPYPPPDPEPDGPGFPEPDPDPAPLDPVPKPVPVNYAVSESWSSLPHRAAAKHSGFSAIAA
jgi:hypothetical protein